MPRKPLLILAVLLLLFFGALALIPSHYAVQKLERLDAPPAVIFPYLDDLHRWSEWSKLDAVEPAVKKTFEGPPSGKGATLRWAGTDAVGEGQITIVESRPPEHLAYEVAWTRPEHARAQVAIDLFDLAGRVDGGWTEEAATAFLHEVEGKTGMKLGAGFSQKLALDGTLVAWKVDGHDGFRAKVFALVIDRKHFAGAALESELQSLRFAAQAAAQQANAPVPPRADAGTVDAGTP